MIISEELLIDFRELSGEHSGENMAKAVWETLKQYDLVGCVSSFDIMIAAKLHQLQIIAFVMDNAMNNDTLVAAIEGCCTKAEVYFSAMES